MAAPQRRTVLITGEGSHQQTAQEVGQFSRYGLKPMIFDRNNHGYLIERLLCKHGEREDNDVVSRNYQHLPAPLAGANWITASFTPSPVLSQPSAQTVYPYQA